MAGLWWQAPELADHMQHALDLINEGRQRQRGQELDACRDYFNALNFLWTTLDRTAPADDPSASADRSTESSGLANLLKKVEPAQQMLLLAMPSVEALARLEPPILSHRVAGMTQLLNDIPDEVKQTASMEHQEFKQTWDCWHSTGSKQTKTLAKLARAVLVVRNNLSHGEKTRVGPDMERRKRNHSVALTVLHVLEDLLDFILDRPSQKLCAYGTLRPGQPNYAVLDVADANWTPITILNGEIADENGLPALTASQHKTCSADLLSSPAVPSLWRRVDEFEGSTYERVLCLYRCCDFIGVGNVYQMRSAKTDSF